MNTVIPPLTNLSRLSNKIKKKFTSTTIHKVTSALKLNLVKTTIVFQSSPIQSQVIAKVDSGTFRHCFTMKDRHALENPIQHIKHGPQVYLPNGTHVSATEAGNLPLHPALTSQATKAHVFPALISSSLISIGQLCDDNCTTVLNKNELKI